MKALIAIDGSPESAAAVETAAHLTWPDDARIDVLTVVPAHVVYAIDPWPGMAPAEDDDLRDRFESDGRRLVLTAVRRLLDAGVPARPRIRMGRAATEIEAAAEEIDADLLILGARGHGMLERAVLGSVSGEVVDRVHRPVLVARRETAARVLIGTDGSVEAIGALSLVARSGLFARAAIEVVHATDVHPTAWLGLVPGDAVFATEAYGRVMDETRHHAVEVVDAAVDLLRAHGQDPTSAVLEGPAAHAIVEEAKRWDADVVVVGARGRGTVERLLLGSTARSLLHHAPASVLIVPGTAVRRREVRKPDRSLDRAFGRVAVAGLA